MCLFFLISEKPPITQTLKQQNISQYNGIILYHLIPPPNRAHPPLCATAPEAAPQRDPGGERAAAGAGAGSPLLPLFSYSRELSGRSGTGGGRTRPTSNSLRERGSWVLLCLLQFSYSSDMDRCGGGCQGQRRTYSDFGVWDFGDTARGQTDRLIGLNISIKY